MGYKIKCVNCGKEVHVSKFNRKTCSYDCAKKYANKKAKERQRKKRNIIYKEKIINCKNCGKEFNWSTSQPRRVYCSEKCAKKFWKKKHEDLKNGVYVGTSGKYENYMRLRFEVFKRDNFTCVYCGRSVKEDKVKLHVDHIIPRSKGGKDVFSNLATACEECNLGKSDVLLSLKKNG